MHEQGRRPPEAPMAPSPQTIWPHQSLTHHTSQLHLDSIGERGTRFGKSLTADSRVSSLVLLAQPFSFLVLSNTPEPGITILHNPPNPLKYHTYTNNSTKNEHTPFIALHHATRIALSCFGPFRS